MRRKRHEHYDSRINQTAVDLFRLGRRQIAAGIAPNATEFIEVSRGLHRALGLRPWMPSVRPRANHHGGEVVSGPCQLCGRSRASSPAGGRGVRDSELGRAS